MTDLEITKLCAEAMGLTLVNRYQFRNAHGQQAEFTPLHDDAQAMALVKRFRPSLGFGNGDEWHIHHRESESWGNNADLNRAICECVANMQKAQSSPA